MKRKKKILLYMWSFSLGGGAEKIAATIVNHLDMSQYEVDILEIEHFDKDYPALQEGVRILKPYKSKKYPRIIEALLWRLRIYAPNLVRRYLVNEQYDVEISFTIMNPPLPFSKRKEVKKIAWIHGSIEAFEHQHEYRSMHDKHLNSADVIVAISEKTKESIEFIFPAYKDKIQLVYNGYDFEALEKKSQETIDITIPEQSMCTIGRLEELKGTDHTLELLRQLHQLGYHYHLYYIGSGEQENVLKERTVNYGLQDFVHFLGYQYNPYAYLNQMKLLVSMSKQEGFPGVYVESLALGVPVVSTDVGGAKELLTLENNGRIIKTDEEAIQAIIHYMEQCSVENQTARKDFVKKFTIEEQMRQIMQLLSEKE